MLGVTPPAEMMLFLVQSLSIDLLKADQVLVRSRLGSIRSSQSVKAYLSIRA